MNLEDFIKRIDANSLGEFLRAATFREHGTGPNGNWNYGCYTCFEFHKEAEPMDEREREEYWYSFENEGPPYNEAIERAKEATELGSGCIFELDGYKIECCYYWDGDGTLSFKIYNDPDTPLASIINTDCKKPHEWEHLAEYNKKRKLFAEL
jgi:hypothetical protein